MAQRELWDDVDFKKLASKAYDCPNTAALMSMVVETTGPQGGDAGQGGAARLRLEESGGTAWEVAVHSKGETYVFSESDLKSVEIRVFGDAEMENLQSALLQAATFLGEVRRKGFNPQKTVLDPPLKTLSTAALESGLAEKLGEMNEQRVSCTVRQVDYGQQASFATRLVVDVSHTRRDSEVTREN